MQDVIIQQALKIATDYQEAEGIYESNKNNLDIAKFYREVYGLKQPRTLAAMILLGEKKYTLTTQDFRNVENFLFPDSTDL